MTKKEKIALRKKLWHINNKEKNNQRNKEYRIKNKDRLAQLQRERRANRKSEIAEYRRSYLSKNINAKLANNLRNRIYEVLKTTKKFNNFYDYLGCTKDELIKYLETQFVSGMSWDNYGIYGWHIDHIRPCASFDLTDAEQQKQCFHYTNLQPLWAKDNLTKSDNIDG